MASFVGERCRGVAGEDFQSQDYLITCLLPAYWHNCLHIVMNARVLFA